MIDLFDHVSLLSENVWSLAQSLFGCFALGTIFNGVSLWLALLRQHVILVQQHDFSY
jgi:hypothetical protein